jgi:hypothetical protein
VFGGRVRDEDFLSEAYEAVGSDNEIPPGAVFVVRDSRPGDEEL